MDDIGKKQFGEGIYSFNQPEVRVLSVMGNIRTPD